MLDLSSENAETRRRTVALFCKLIKRGAEAGIRRFIAHPSGEPVTTDEALRARRIAIAKDTLASLAEVAALHGAEIAVENLPRTCLGSTVSEMETLISGNEKLSVCFDTNHLLTDREELPRPKTILRERELTPRDLAKNASEIFSGQPITTFSRRIDGLGMWH